MKKKEKGERETTPESGLLPCLDGEKITQRFWVEGRRRRWDWRGW